MPRDGSVATYDERWRRLAQRFGFDRANADFAEIVLAVLEKLDAETAVQRASVSGKRWHWYMGAHGDGSGAGSVPVIVVVGEGVDVATWPVVVRLQVGQEFEARAICDAHNGASRV